MEDAAGGAFLAPIRRVCNGRGGQAGKETVLQGRWTLRAIDPFHERVILRGVFLRPPRRGVPTPDPDPNASEDSSQDTHGEHKRRTFVLSMHAIAHARLLASACWMRIGRCRLVAEVQRGALWPVSCECKI